MATVEKKSACQHPSRPPSNDANPAFEALAPLKEQMESAQKPKSAEERAAEILAAKGQTLDDLKQPDPQVSTDPAPQLPKLMIHVNEIRCAKRFLRKRHIKMNPKKFAILAKKHHLTFRETMDVLLVKMGFLKKDPGYISEKLHMAKKRHESNLRKNQASQALEPA